MNGEQNSNKITISFAAVNDSQEKEPSPRITFKIPLGGADESEPANESSGGQPAEECEDEYLEGDEDVHMASDEGVPQSTSALILTIPNLNAAPESQDVVMTEQEAAPSQSQQAAEPETPALICIPIAS